MFGSKRKLDDLMAQLRPDLSREALGVGPAFPGVAPNPVLSGDARKRNAELRTGTLALGVLVDWREVNNNPRLVLMLDVETADGVSFRGIADESFTITELTRLAPDRRCPCATAQTSWTTTSPSRATRILHWCSSSRMRSRDASGADPIARAPRLATIAIRPSGTTQPASAGRSTGRPLAAHSEMPPVTFTAS